MSSSKLTLPLYQNEILQGMISCPIEANTGLWYEKFCNLWTKNEEKKYWELGDNKLEWIKKVSERSPVGNSEMIGEAVDRLESLVEEKKGRILFMKTEGRFVTGLGRPHPIENGFSWHPTLGTAYLPGTSVKGLTRAWASLWSEEKDKQEMILRILGHKDNTDPSQAGNIIFMDVIPVGPVKLEADIMTPHYQTYYQNPTEPAIDKDDPNPIPFLTVAKGQTFLFSFMPRVNVDEDDMNKVEQWLLEALEWIGAGAKTAVGYGRFKKDNIRQREWMERIKEREKQKILQCLTPVQREMMEDGYYDDNHSERFMEVMTKKWLPRLEDMTDDEPDRKEIAEQLAKWYQKHRKTYWKKPNKKNKSKITLIKKILSEE